MAITVETKHLLLRPFTDADVDLVVELDSDPEVMRYLTGGVATPRAAVVDSVLPRFRSWDDLDPFGYAAAHERSTGAFVGWFAIHPADRTASVDIELGYRLRRAAWGHGYATEGSIALVDRAFTAPEVERVWAQTMAVNTASRKVMRRAGLRYVRTFHPAWLHALPGAEAGEVTYAVTRCERTRAEVHEG